MSKLGEGTFHHPNRGIMAGGIDYIRQSAQMQEVRDRYIKGSLTPPGPPTQHGIYASPEWTGQPYPSLGWQNIRQDQEPPEGWPRPPKFNKPGDVPGPPVQYGDPITPQTVKAEYGFIDNGIIEKNLYFYHPDHLGSSSYITDIEGRITQHTEYIAFGEVLFEEHSTSRTMPYLFNGKELDTETGLYYYGARYYDAKTSIFLNVDPLAEKYPHTSPYTYVNNNPIMLVDPDGRAPMDDITVNKYGKIIKIVRNDSSNRFFNEKGKQLFFNDSENVDKINLKSGVYNKGDQLFNYIPKERFAKFMKAAGFDALRYNLKVNQAQKEGDKDAAMSNRYIALEIAKKESYNKADFAISTLLPNYSYPEYETNRRRPYLDSIIETKDYFIFGESNVMYNLFDAGNYMWGSWMHLNGFERKTVKFGSNLNELMRGNMGDTEADQRAIFNGFNFKGYTK